MSRFQQVEVGGASPTCGVDGGVIARRYRVLRSLGRGSFGTVYLVSDVTAADGDQLKVLKQVHLGDLRPDETVRANQEARLLSQLHHPSILTFHRSFLEGDALCIITEYCQDRDLDCKLQEVRQSGRSLPESQVIDWLLQLLLGLHYMHDRRIIHRDLKAKNVFLKRNLLKIGDFGVSCLLMGSCDLATTFTGTPYYMSPEVLTHQGYDSKADIWALGCLLYQMCHLSHAFQGPNFVSVVMKIVEGDTPALPAAYSADLNSVLQKMLQKHPSCRPSAADVLRTRFMEDNMQKMKKRFVCVSSGAEDAELIARHMQTKVHLQTLRERSEVEKMTPRERMRLRKMEAADERALRLRKLAEEKYEEIHRRRRELRRRDFETVSLDVLKEDTLGGACQSEPISRREHQTAAGSQPINDQDESTGEGQDIPEDPQAAEVYYCQDVFESCSSEDEEETVYLSEPQLGELEAMMEHMQEILDVELSGAPVELSGGPGSPQGPPPINSSLLKIKIHHLRQSLRNRLGSDVFQQVYQKLQERRQSVKEDEQEEEREDLQVDQLLFYEEELQKLRRQQEEEEEELQEEQEGPPA